MLGQLRSPLHARCARASPSNHAPRSMWEISKSLVCLSFARPQVVRSGCTPRVAPRTYWTHPWVSHLPRTSTLLIPLPFSSMACGRATHCAITPWWLRVGSPSTALDDPVGSTLSKFPAHTNPALLYWFSRSVGYGDAFECSHTCARRCCFTSVVGASV